MAKAAIGIDVGGTKVSVVLGTEQGRILARREFPTPVGKNAKQALGKINGVLSDFLTVARLKKLRVSGVGIGLPGAVDSVAGKVPQSPNLPGWGGMPLKQHIETAFHIPVFLANDANAAACAEKIFGTAKKVSDFVYITVSTGVGGGVFIGGKLLTGASFAAGEIGHIPVVPEGNLCGCGRLGCLEAHASGTAIGKEYTRLTGKKVSGAKDVKFRAHQGERKAVQAMETAAYHLGTGLGIVLNLLNPEMIVLGGGVFQAAPAFFLKRALARCKQVAWTEAYRVCKIRPSILKGSAGDLGALALPFLNQK